MLWLWDHHWPELIHPFSSAIDTELPVADELVCVRGVVGAESCFGYVVGL